MSVLSRWFFYCYGDHRDLHVLAHSFPTRRSSDLARGLDGAELRHVVVELQHRLVAALLSGAHRPLAPGERAVEPARLTDGARVAPVRARVAVGPRHGVRVQGDAGVLLIVRRLVLAPGVLDVRSEESRVGKECVSTVRCGGSPYH